MAKLPAFQFYPGDWMKDPELRSCSTFARGLLVDLLCLLHEAKSRGRFVWATGDPWTDEEIVQALPGADPIDARLLALTELLKRGVLKRDSEGIVHSSSMVRDEHIRTVRVESGSKGGSKTQAKLKQGSSKRSSKAQAKSGPSSSSSASASSLLASTVAVATSPSASAEENTVPNGTARGGKPDPVGTYSTDFLKFWVGFPDGRKKSKGAAWKSWQAAIKLADVETIVTKAGEYAMSAEGRGDYVKMPSTWLNQRCWEDDPAAWAAKDSNGKSVTSDAVKSRTRDAMVFNPEGKP